MEESLRERVLAHVRSPGYRPQTKSEIARALGIPPDERAALRQALRELLGEGMLVEGRNARLQLRLASQGLLKGIVYIRGDGRALFAPDFRETDNAAQAKQFGMSEASRLRVTEGYLGTAMHGDKVLAKIKPVPPPPWLDHAADDDQVTLEARIVEVLDRRNETITGTLHTRGKFAWVKPDDPLLPSTIELISSDIPAVAGDKVLLGIAEWAGRGKHPRGRILERLGQADDPGMDVLCLIHRFRLPNGFPSEVLREAEAFAPEISETDLVGREDWRQREVITIDPFDARDFDDAIAVTPLPQGGWELAVHIADVSHYVQPDTALDREARKRGNSVYLVDRVLPMLPERLSNGLCSLRPNEDRLTRAAIMTFDAKGKRIGTRFAKAVIRSQRRYTYEEASQELKAATAAEKDHLLPRAWALASLLRKRRFANGSLELDFPEIKIVLDEKGKPARMVRIDHDESHQLIEEFMLAANEAVAAHLLQAGVPSLYRIHEEPDPDKLEELRALLLSQRIHVGDLSVRGELQAALRIIATRPDAPVLKLAVLKSMKRAAYHAEALGHYGLALRNYTHFTSPIRRYADLVVHRVQARVLWRENLKVPSQQAMQEIATHISLTERTAAEAENESRRMKEMDYFELLARQPKPPKFQAVVMDVRRVGVFVELAEILTRGIILAEDLGTEAHYDALYQRFALPKKKRHIRPGDILDVFPLRVDRERRSVGFRL